MEDTIFTKIIKGHVPCYKIFEDDRTIAFLDIHPVQPGHVLVVPKTQIDHLWDLTDEDYQALMDVCKNVAQRIRKVLKPARVGVQVVGTDIPHAHVHLIPFSKVEEFHNEPDLTAEPDNIALAEMAKRLMV